MKYLKLFENFEENDPNDESYEDLTPIGIGTPEGINGFIFIFSPLESDMVEVWNSDPNIQKWVSEEKILLQQQKYDEWSIWGIEGDKEVENYIMQHFSW